MNRIAWNRTIAMAIAFAAVAFTSAAMRAQENANTAGDVVATAAKYLPEEAIATLSVWPSQTAKLPRFALAPLEVASAAGLEQIGIDPLTIQRLDIFSSMPGPAGPQFGAVLQMQADTDAGSLNPQVFQDQDSSVADEKGFKFRSLAGPPNVPLVLHQVGPRVLLIGTKPFVKRMLTQRRNVGSLGTTLAATKSSQDAFLLLSVSSIAPILTGNIEAMRREIPPKLAADLDTVVKSTDFLAVRLMLNESEKLQVVASAVDEAAAGKLEASLKSAMEFGATAIVQQTKRDIAQDGSKTSEAMHAYIDRVATSLTKQFAPRRSGKRVMLEVEGLQNSATVGTLVGLLLPAVQSAREAARRMQSSNNLKQLAIGMLNYESAYKRFPSTVIADKATGKSLLSWRVALLPFIEQAELYNQFHLDESWDSPHNIKLLPKMPATYKHPNRIVKPGHTVYVAPVNDETALSASEPTKLSAITDGLSNTILLLEVADKAAVPWTAPDDLEIDFDEPFQILDVLTSPTFQAAFCDGSVRALSTNMDITFLVGLITRAGGETVELDR